MELYRLTTMLAAIGCLLVAAAGLVGGVAPAWDVVNNLAPVTLGVALAVLAAEWAIKRERIPATTLCAGFAALVGLGLTTPELFAAIAQPRVEPRGQTIKVIQHNLWSENVDPAGTARWLIAQRADILVLEEVVGNAGSVPYLVRRAYPYRSRCEPDILCTTLILSRVRPSSSGAWPSADRDGFHSAAWATFGEGPQAFTVVGDHAPWPLPKHGQREQTALFASRLPAFDRGSLIVAGDFNSTPWSYALRRQDRLFGLQRRSRALFSFPVRTYSRWRLHSPVPLLPIDHIYAGVAWKTASVQAGQRTGSDHLPIVAVLTR